MTASYNYYNLQIIRCLTFLVCVLRAFCIRSTSCKFLVWMVSLLWVELMHTVLFWFGFMFYLWSERWIYDDFVDLLGMENESEKGKNEA